MQNITKSASKIVLLAVTGTICIALLYGVVTQQVDYKDITVAFIALMNGVAGFYFANKGESSTDYLGK